MGDRDDRIAVGSFVPIPTYHESVVEPPESEWMVSDEPFHDSELEDVHQEPVAPSWRRPLLIGVAALTAVAMLLLPVYNLIDQNRSVADNGLEVCGFDYCIVQDATRAAGLDETMSRLATTYLSDEEASQFAEVLLAHLGESQVAFVVVDQLGGDLKGQYDTTTQTILVERPVRAWIVVHEAAHAVASGHGEAFQEVVIELAGWLEKARGD